MTKEKSSEPVARVNSDGFIVEVGDLPLAPGMYLYTAPQPLNLPSEHEIAKAMSVGLIQSEHMAHRFVDQAKAVLALLKEINK